MAPPLPDQHRRQDADEARHARPLKRQKYTAVDVETPRDQHAEGGKHQTQQAHPDGQTGVLFRLRILVHQPPELFGISIDVPQLAQVKRPSEFSLLAALLQTTPPLHIQRERSGIFVLAAAAQTIAVHGSSPPSWVPVSIPVSPWRDGESTRRLMRLDPSPCCRYPDKTSSLASSGNRKRILLQASRAAGTRPHLSELLAALCGANFHNCQQRTQDVQAVYASLVTAAQQNPDDLHSGCDAALVLSHLSGVRPARASLENICQRWPDHPRPWAERAALADRCGMLTHALSLYERALQCEEIPLLHGLRGWLLTRLGREDEAEHSWRRFTPAAPPWPTADLPIRVVDGNYPQLRSLLAHRAGCLLLGWDYEDGTGTDCTDGISVDSEDLNRMLSRCLLLCRLFAWPLACVVPAHREAEPLADFLAHHLKLPVARSSTDPALVIALHRDHLPASQPGQVTFALSAAPFSWAALPDICGVLQPLDSCCRFEGPFELYTLPENSLFLGQVERWFRNPHLRPQLQPTRPLNLPISDLAHLLNRLAQGDQQVSSWWCWQDNLTAEVGQRALTAFQRSTELEHRRDLLVLALRGPDVDVEAVWNLEPSLRSELLDAYNPETGARLTHLALFTSDTDGAVVERALEIFAHLDSESTPHLADRSCELWRAKPTPELLERLQQLWPTDSSGGAIAFLIRHLGVEPFIPLLQDEHCQFQALRCILSAAGSHHVHLVRPYLRYPNSSIRRIAARRLASWHDRASFSAMVEVVRQDGPRNSRLLDLARIGGCAAEPLILDYLATHPGPALEALQQLQSPAGLQRARELPPSSAAADYLGVFGTAEDEFMLESYLLEPHARYPAARALWIRDWPLARHVFEAGLATREWMSRHTLQTWQDPRAAELLQTAGEDGPTAEPQEVR